LIFSVRGGFMHYLGDLLGSRECSHLLGIGDDFHEFVHERVIGRVPTSVEKPSEEIRSDSG